MDQVMRRLDRHRSIALDMDQTLVGGRNSGLLRDYVMGHRCDKLFYIITFRDEGWAASIPQELAYYGFDMSVIKKIVWCPARLIDAATLHYQSTHGLLPFHRMAEEAARAGLCFEDIGHLSREYGEWKGKAAFELGCTALVDDLPEMVKAGCEKFAVELIDIAELNPE